MINRFFDRLSSVFNDILTLGDDADGFPQEVTYGEVIRFVSDQSELHDATDLWMSSLSREMDEDASGDLGRSFNQKLKRFETFLRSSGYDRETIALLMDSMRKVKTSVHVKSIRARIAPAPKKDNRESASRSISQPTTNKFDVSRYNTSQSIVPQAREPEPPKEGVSEYRPLDINNTFANGFLYYPIQIVVGEKEAAEEDGDGVSSIKEHIKTVVIRSDRTVRHALASNAPADVERGSTVYRLDDGVLVNGPPKANSHGTWQWESIERYLNGNMSDVSLDKILNSIHKHLYSKVWLPNESDYWMLSLACVASYVQSAFESVPLFLLTGKAGTGKSELGSAMNAVSCNSVMIGQVSPAGMARLIDESGGLVVIDDLESIGGKGGFSEMAQTLKMSYKKSTAVKAVTDPKTQRSTLMNFFGIKVISNTKGSDSILGSRLFRIQTQSMPDSEKAAFIAREKFPEDDLSRLRNDCHCWAFENVHAVLSMYTEVLSSKTDRNDEIAAPLRAIAMMSSNIEVYQQLEHSINLQDSYISVADWSAKERAFKEAVTRIIRDGYTTALPTHIDLEIRTIVSPAGVSHRRELPSWLQPEWIGRYLREMGLADEKAPPKRIRLHEKHMRTIRFDNALIAELNPSILNEDNATKPESFCQECSTCRYSSHMCEIRIERLKQKSKKGAPVTC